MQILDQEVWRPGPLAHPPGQLAEGSGVGSPSPPRTIANAATDTQEAARITAIPLPSGLCPADDKGGPRLAEALRLIRSRCGLMSPGAAGPGPGRHLSPRLPRRDAPAPQASLSPRHGGDRCLESHHREGTGAPAE